MLFITDYKLRSHLTRDDDKRLMDVFAQRGGKSPGEIAHYVRMDGSGGVVVSDNSDMLELYSYLLAFGEFMEFDIAPALTIDDAVGPILKELED